MSNVSKREGEEIGQTVSRKLKPGDSFRSTKGRKRLRRQARSAECSVCFGISASPSRVCRKLCAGQADCNVLPPIHRIPDEEEHASSMEKSVLPRERILRVRSHSLLLVLFYACALKKLQGLNSFLWWTICVIIINSGLIRNFVEIKLVFIYCVIVKQGENPRKRYKIIQCMRMYIIYIFRHIKLRNKKKRKYICEYIYIFHFLRWIDRN